MKITKATRWRVFAGVWIQSLFTSATAFFSLFALPLDRSSLAGAARSSAWRTPFICSFTALWALWAPAGRKAPAPCSHLSGPGFLRRWLVPHRFCLYHSAAIPVLRRHGWRRCRYDLPACLPTALKWFPDKAGSISGLVQAGASCGPFIMSPIAQWLIDTYGAQMACRILRSYS